MSNFTRVYFPGLGIDFDLPSVAFTIGSYDIHFYGIIIAFGFMLAVLYGGRMAQVAYEPGRDDGCAHLGYGLRYRLRSGILCDF